MGDVKYLKSGEVVCNARFRIISPNWDEMARIRIEDGKDFRITDPDCILSIPLYMVLIFRMKMRLQIGGHASVEIYKDTTMRMEKLSVKSVRQK